MNPAAIPTIPLDKRARWLALVALVLALLLAWHGPIAQWTSYHAFADTRVWWRLPNAANVLSNLPFALVALWGGWSLRHMLAPSRRAWLMFAAAVGCTAIGSSVYHWHPDNTRLVFDRMPIAWACASLLCGFLAERLDPRWSQPGTLALAWLAATLSVVWWWAGGLHGQGDLRLYLFVQFLPMLLVPVALLLKLPARPGPGVPASAWWTVLALYGAAKVLELADHQVLGTLGLVSGHTLKHLLAAGAAACLLRSVVLSCGSRR